MPAELTNLICPMQILGALQAKKRNSKGKLKSDDKILNSSPVSIFFDKFFYVSSPNKILAIELCESNLAGEFYNVLK